MAFFKYCGIAVGIIIGSEVVYRCIRYMLISDSENNEKIFTKVIFFPDKGMTNKVKTANTNLPEKGLSGKTLSRTSQYAGAEHDDFCTKIISSPARFGQLPAINSLAKPPTSTEEFEFSDKTLKQIEDSELIHKEDENMNDETRKIFKSAEAAPNFPFNNKQKNGSLWNQELLSSTCGSVEKRNNLSISDSDYLALTNIDSSISPLVKRSTSLIHMVDTILSAKRSLRICIFVFTCKELAAAVVMAKQRGVKVRVFMDPNMMTSSRDVVGLLKGHNILIRQGHPAHIMHHKFAVVDGPESPLKEAESAQDRKTDGRFNLRQHEPHWSGVVMSGSFNWTWSAVVNNYENVFITNDPHVVGLYAAEFEKVWSSLT